jgi:glycosyltransferase involved in cell wall biosynthesis
MASIKIIFQELIVKFMQQNKHVLIIPRGHLMTQVMPLASIFEFHQAKALKDSGFKVGMISIGSIPFRKEFLFYPYNSIEVINGIFLLRNYKRFLIPFRLSNFSRLKKRYFDLFFDQFKIYVDTYGLPDIIHAHNFLFSGLVAMEISKLYNIPYVITEHSSSYALGRISKKMKTEIKICSNKAKKVLAVSSSFAKLLNEKFGLSTLVLPNIIDDAFTINDFSTKKSNEHFVFLNVAALDSNKNHELLIRSFAITFKGTRVILKIAGIGPLRNKLEILCKDLGVADQVLFLGLLTRDKVKDEMFHANCFVLSSNYETFGVVLIEALSCGIPVISTDCGGPIDIVSNFNGLLIDVGNVEQLSNAMKYMFINKSMYDPTYIRAEVLKKFGAETFVEQVSKIYNC